MALLDGLRAVVTGSSRGLGRAFACGLAANGAAVVINGTNPEPLAETKRLIREAGGEVTPYVGSVAEMAHCEALIGTCVEAYGGIDLLVNNAGIVRDRTLLKMSEEEFDDVIAVNLRGAWACSKFAGLQMREQGKGHIVHIISASGMSGGVGQGNYAAAKAGMMGLLRTAILELTRYGIRTNALWPVAETDMTQVVFERARQMAEANDQPVPTPRQLGFGKPHEIAQALVWLASEKAERFNGQCFSCNGTKIAHWTHPREVAIGLRDEPWSVADIDAHFADVEPQEVYRPRG
jgi:3-oxoacyl-[acyl-carrier protein] reductase